ncbi:MAG: prepilin-type N-terminal cleavage/methylation domain-containing protein [Limisphaerales bacterium]
MNKKFRISDFGFRIDGKRGSQSRPTICIPHSAFRNRRAFTLVEILVVVVLMALIVLALMAVFNSTQSAFRASITQTDVLEGGRSVMGLITSDFESMAPSFGISNSAVGAANFYAAVSSVPPLMQSLVASGQQRQNVLENFFILSRQNTTWYGSGYAVTTNSPVGGLYSLYRFTTNHPVMTTDPAFIFTNDFMKFLQVVTNGSHLVDGVVHLTVRAYDPNGYWMTNTTEIYSGWYVTNRNVWFFPPLNGPNFLPGPGSGFGEIGFWMFSNTVPAAVEIQLGVVEDRTLQRAESIPDPTTRSNYLAQHAGQVHLFRQRIPIRNVDPSAYQ